MCSPTKANRVQFHTAERWGVHAVRPVLGAGSRSAGREADAAVDPDDLTVHVWVGDELDHHEGEFFAVAEALGEEHRLAEVGLELVGLFALSVDGGVDEAGGDGVDADADG